VNRLAREEGLRGEAVQDHWLVQAKMAMLAKDFRTAELMYVEQGKTDDAIEMYQQLHRWDQAIEVADVQQHPEAEEMRKNYFQYLLDSGQEERAAALKDQEGDHQTAISLYLKGGLPAKSLRWAPLGAKEASLGR
jgi:intraflagellar transport protein 172